MSYNFNYNLWVTTKKNIHEVIGRQNFMKTLQPIQDRRISFKFLSELYVLYSDLVSKLNTLYCYAYHVQKRDIVRMLLQAATRRLVELKTELKSLELNEFVYMDKTLISRKLTPYDMVIWRSPHFLYRRPPELENFLFGNKILADPEQKLVIEANKKEERRIALILIQAHERARQARVYKAAIKYDRKNLIIPEDELQRYRFTADSEAPMSIPVKRTIFSVDFIRANANCADMLPTEEVEEIIEMDTGKQEAARVIQRAWRVYKARLKFRRRAIGREIVYGTRMARRTENPERKLNEITEYYEAELRKRKFDEKFLQLMSNERVRLLQQRSVYILEDISDHIRGWFREFYDGTGNFHPYPEALKSGTILVLLDETYSVDEFKTKQEEMGLSKEEKKKRAQKEREKKKKAKELEKKLKLRMQKQKAAGIYDIAHELKTNENLNHMVETMRDYKEDWKKINEYLIKYEPIEKWITDGELAKIHRELRALADEFMRIEYELLRRALAQDQKKKYKDKKKKAKKQGKKKEAKDVLADRTPESLYEEMKEAGVIQSVPNLNFNDFFGDFNFVADDTRDDYNLTTVPGSRGDIMFAIQECLLGMGDVNVEKTKSLCIIGPYNYGKKLLCKIIASELDAVFIDLSPEKTAAFADDLNYFIQAILKIAKAFQPTILYIQDVHRVFWKKVPQNQEELNPRLLEKVLLKKIVNQIKSNDKIMLLATSDMPWSAKPKLKKAFQRFLLIPKNDYGTSLLIWLELMAKYANRDGVADYAISALAKTMQKYYSGEVCDNFEKTLSIERRARLLREKLDPFEFLDTNLNADPPLFPKPDKVILKFEKWYKRANKLVKERNAFLKKQNPRDKKK